MKLLLAILCLSMTSCAELWMAEYRRQGGYYQRPSQPTPEEAAENVKSRPGSSQPTIY
jgi:hypothetical protein